MLLQKKLVGELFKLVCYFNDLKPHEKLQESITQLKIATNTGNFEVVIKKISPNIITQVYNNPEILKKKQFDETMFNLILNSQFKEHIDVIKIYEKLIPENEKNIIWANILSIVNLTIQCN
jgi:hypothetical protein